MVYGYICINNNNNNNNFIYFFKEKEALAPRDV